MIIKPIRLLESELNKQNIKQVSLGAAAGDSGGFFFFQAKWSTGKYPVNHCSEMVKITAHRNNN